MITLSTLVWGYCAVVLVASYALRGSTGFGGFAAMPLLALVIPMKVLVSIPMSVVFAEADRALARNLIGIVLATLLLLIAAWYGTGIFVLRKVNVLLDAARRVHSGDLNARTGMSDEGGELGLIGRHCPRRLAWPRRRCCRCPFRPWCPPGWPLLPRCPCPPNTATGSKSG